MANPSNIYVFDSFALLSHLQAEAGAAQVRGLLEAGSLNTARLCLSVLNAGEVYYLIYRRRGVTLASAFLQDLSVLPLVLFSVTEERVFAAARLKAIYSISYADAFAATLALELGATLVTGDREFRPLEPRLRVLWLPE